MSEIERKFLIHEDGTDYSFQALSLFYASFEDLKQDITERGVIIRQGYMPLDKGAALASELQMDLTFTPAEARLRNKGGALTFTIKGDGTVERNELETSISQETFDEYWPSTEGKRVEKIRVEKPLGRFVFEFDFYLDRQLTVVEVECKTIAEAQTITPPGKDITKDKRYKNKNLAK